MKFNHIFFLSALLLIGFGCTSSRVVTEKKPSAATSMPLPQTPELAITSFGTVTFRNRTIQVRDVASTISAAGYQRKDEGFIRVPVKRNEALMEQVKDALKKGGYRRVRFLTERVAKAELGRESQNR